MIFISGTVGMLMKTWHTKDVESYSWWSIMLNNAGNLVYWVYILSLPFGPIYFLHGFYTIATLLMGCWCHIYRKRPETAKRITGTIKRVTQTLTMSVVPRDENV